MRSNPVNFVDPNGEFAFVLAAPLIGSGAAAALDFVLGFALGTAVLNAAQNALSSGNTSSASDFSDSDFSTETVGDPNNSVSCKTGPSGKPKVHSKNHPTKKRAKDAARQEGKGKPVQHPSPKKGKPHFHPVDAQGNKAPGSTHHNYPR